MQKPLVSVIVPVYRQHQNAVSCLVSIIQSSYKNIEIIAVTDDIRYVQSLVEDSRIKYVKCTDPYIGDARNAGMKLAKGKYFSFVDADDIICDAFISSLVKEMESDERIDIAESAIEVFETVYYPVLYEHVLSHRCAESTEEKFALLEQYPDDCVCQTNKLYRAETFRNLCYPSGLLCEDDAMIYDEWRTARKIIYLNGPMYGRRLERSALTESEISEQYFIDSIKARIHVLDSVYADSALNVINKADSSDWMEFMISRMMDELIELYPHVPHTEKIINALKDADVKYNRYRRFTQTHLRYDMFFAFPYITAAIVARLGDKEGDDE